ncbi:MAG: hypothetical protein K8H90_03870 [Thermoanaerobaculia bacterium]|nr:hypothetical protein [Thermoanaerobaculia bacterium]
MSERTWISEYETFPDGGKGTYRTYDYFRRDGHLVWVDNWIHREPRSDPADRWRVDGPRLCFVNGRFSREEKCFTVALDAQEAIQLYIDAPGTSNHELLTRVIRQTAAGAPRVTPSPAGP